jgi:hypothetical protein
MADAATGLGPTVPATAATDLPDGVVSSEVIWDEITEQGNYTSRLLPQGSVLRLADADGDACIQLLLYRADNTAERLNVADTVKVQWQAYLDEGAVLLSDMGRALATLVADTSARHDCLCGGTNAVTATARWGDGSVAGATPNARDLLALGAAKHGLGRVDVGPAINLFKRVRVDDDGSMHLDGAPAPRTHVHLRCEMDLVVVLANTPHPLDERSGYHSSPVRCTAWLPAFAGVADRSAEPFRGGTPERHRAYENTDELLSGRAR